MDFLRVVLPVTDNFIPRFICCSLLLTLCVSSTSAVATQNMTLAECLQIGMSNNPGLQASRFKVDSADRDVKVARADFLPAVTSSLSASRIGSISAKGPTQSDYIDQDIHSANIKVTQILYAGSRIVNQHEKAQFIEQATQAEFELAKLELMYNIETNFFKLMKSKQDVISANEAVSRLTEGAKIAEAFFRKELAPYVDLLKAQVDLDDAKNQLSIAKNNENRQRVALFSLMNQPMDPDVEFSNEVELVLQKPPSFDTCFATAMEKRPDIKSLTYQRQASDKLAAISLGKYLPTVRLEGGYNDYQNDYAEMGATLLGSYDRDQTNRYWLAGISLSWDLFDGGRAWYENEKYDLEGQRFGALIQDARNNIATGIRKALYSMEEAEQRLAGSSDAIAAAQENYTAEEKRLKVGVSTITALLDAQSRLVRAKTNAINATLDYRLAHSELKFMSGGETNWLPR